MKTNNSTLNICVVEHRGDGGMIHYAYQLCSSYSNLGAEVKLVTSTEYELDELPHNFQVIKLLKLWPTSKRGYPEKPRFLSDAYRNIRRAFRGIKYIIEWLRLYRYLIKHQPDIIQFGKIEFEFEAIFLKWLKKKNLTMTQICHEFESREKTKGSFVTNFFQDMFNDLYQNFSILFFHAEDNLNRFQSLHQLPKQRLKIIPHGNENIFTQFGVRSDIRDKLISKYQIDIGTPVILFFGVLAPSKGIPNLLKAFATIQEEIKVVKLIIAGAPSKHLQLQELHDLADELNIQQNIYFDSRYIPNDEVGSLMSLAQVVVYPYISSTQSGSLQVAYTFGKPVVATRVGGLPEVVEHGKSGYLVPEQDPKALANVILTLVKNPQKAKKMGDYAKHLSETKFSWDSIAQTILYNYQDIIFK